MPEVSTTPAPGAITAPTAGPTPVRHLLNMMIDALTVPSPAGDPGSQSAYLVLLARRSGLVRDACRTALSSTSDRGLWRRSRGLASLISSSARFARPACRSS